MINNLEINHQDEIFVWGKWSEQNLFSALQHSQPQILLQNFCCKLSRQWQLVVGNGGGEPHLQLKAMDISGLVAILILGQPMNQFTLDDYI